MTTTNRPLHAPSPPPEAPTALTSDDVFHVLQTSRRREAMRYLLRTDDPVKMRDVAEHVAAREHGTTVAELTTTQRQRVYIPLYQSHLPKLDEAGVIEYDKPRGIVRSTDRLELFRPYLEVTSPPPDTPEDRDGRAVDRGDRQAEGDTRKDESGDREDGRSDHRADRTVREDDRNTRYYATAIAASVGLLLASAVGVVQFPGILLGAVITTLFVLATAACHLVRPEVGRSLTGRTNRR